MRYLIVFLGILLLPALASPSGGFDPAATPAPAPSIAPHAIVVPGRNGHGGKLALTMDWVYSADHGKILLSNIDHATGNDTDKKGAASTATIVSYVVLGPLGLFAHNFVHGKEVTIPTTKIFTVFVDHDVHVAATQKSDLAGFDN